MSKVSKKWTKAVRRERTPIQTLLNKQKKWILGKKVFLTIKNPNKQETNKKFIRVPAEQVWKKHGPYMMKQNTTESL